MDRKVIVEDYQELPASDLMAFQDYGQAGADTLIKYAIHDGQAYAGFAATSSGVFEVTVQPGIYLAGGKMFVRREAQTLDLIQYQPIANKVMVALVVWGSTVDQNPEYRAFVVNLETEETEARQINLERARIANIGSIGGVESGDPQSPIIPNDRIAVAFVVLNPNGIESIIANTDNDLSSVRRNDQRLNDVEAWQAIAQPRISTIATDVANLSNAQEGRVTTSDLFSMAGDIARLKELMGLPDDYADYGADHFLNSDETDTADVNLLCKVEEGIRFGPANESVAEMALFSAINAQVTQAGGMVLPKFNSALRFKVEGYVGEESISQYTQTSYDITQKTMSRTRVRWGQTYEYCTNSQWWRSGQFDSVTGVFTRNGESFQVLSGDTNQAHGWIRLRQFWEDTYEEPYWDVVTSTYTLNGAQVAQTFLNSQAGWLTGLDLYFTRKGTAGDVHVLLTETTDSGTPNLKKTIAKVTIPYLSIKSGQVTTAAFTPTYLEAGKRYAYVLVTQGEHYVAMADGGEYLAGTFFYSTDGAYFAGDITKDMQFGLRFAKFAYSRVVVDLQPLNLNGGIAGVDIMAPMKVPDACKLTFEVQVPGTGWVSISSINVNALIGLPPLLNFRAIFQGTPDLQPGLFLTGSQLKLSRPRTTFKHISTPRILAGASDSVRIEWQLGNWTPANHMFTAKLVTAGGEELPDVVEDIQLPEKRIKRIMTFNLDNPVAAFDIVCDGTTTSALDVFHVEERVDIEF